MKASAVLCLFLVGFLSGCGASDPTHANLDNLLKGRDVTILELSPTVAKEINGSHYQVAKVRVKGKNGFGMPVENTIGYVLDAASGNCYTVDLETFEKFLKTGDKSGFPEIQKPLSVDN